MSKHLGEHYWLKLREQNLHSWLELSEEDVQVLHTRHPSRDSRTRASRTRTRRDRDMRQREADH